MQLRVWLHKILPLRQKSVSGADDHTSEHRASLRCAAAFALPTLLPPRIWITKINKTCACFYKCLVFQAHADRIPEMYQTSRSTRYPEFERRP